MTTFDAVIVSSSPITLLEALARAGAGERVLVVDDSDRLGGAWDYGAIGDYRRVELGGHILRYHPGCYRFLEDFLGLQMQPMLPAPLGYSCRPGRAPRAARYEHARWKLDYIGDRIAHAGRPNSWRRLEQDVLRPLVRAGLMWLDERRGRGAVQMYPVGGTPALIDRIREMVMRSNVEVRLGTRLCGVDRHGDTLTCDLGTTTVKARQLVLTHQARIDQIRVNGQQFPATGDLREAMQLVCIVEDATPISCSFVEFNGHPRLRRVSDVTPYTKDYVHGQHKEKVIAISLRAFIAQDESIVPDVIEDLRQCGIIAANARLRHARWWSYRTTKQSPEAMRSLQSAMGSTLAMLETRDLAAAIEQYAERWSSTLARWTPMPAARRGRRRNAGIGYRRAA